MSITNNLNLTEELLETFDKWEDKFLAQVKSGHHNDNQDLTMAFLKLGYLIENLTYTVGELVPVEDKEWRGGFIPDPKPKAKKKKEDESE